MISRELRIYNALLAQLNPETLVVENESHKHNVPEGSETHFKITAVSNTLAGKPRVARHREVLEKLKPEFASGLHALSLHLYTKDEWLKRQGQTQASPPCRDGMHHDPLKASTKTSDAHD
jgi:BolA protein